MRAAYLLDQGRHIWLACAGRPEWVCAGVAPQQYPQCRDSAGAERWKAVAAFEHQHDSPITKIFSQCHQALRQGRDPATESASGPSGSSQWLS